MGRLFYCWLFQAWAFGHHLARGPGIPRSVDAAEHAGDLFDLAFRRQAGDTAVCVCVLAARLVHEQVLVTLGGHLRQVGNGQTRPRSPRRRSSWPTTSAVGADADVRLRRTPGRHARGLCGDHLDGQADP